MLGSKIDQQGQKWSALVEKAWAKICGSYAKIISGNRIEAFLVLTGAHCEVLNLDESNKEKIWADIYEASHNE